MTTRSLAPILLAYAAPDRAEGRRQRAEYYAAAVRQAEPYRRYAEEWRALQAHRAALRSPVDRLAQRLSFGEAAAKTIWGSTDVTNNRAYWRHRACYAGVVIGGPDDVDAAMTTARSHVAGVSKSELVWAHIKALCREHGPRCIDTKCRCSVIGPPSPLPG